MKLTKCCLRLVTCRMVWGLLASLGFLSSAFAGSATGTVTRVQADSTLGGVFLELNTGSSFYYESSCPVPGVAFLPSSDPLYSTLVSNMLSAQASGTTITVSTSGCVSVPRRQQARIYDIQLGTRIPGT